jgi:hypothetical protein
MITREPIAAGELSVRTGRLGVTYTDETTGMSYEWDSSISPGKFQPTNGRVRYRTGAAVAGTGTVTAAQLVAGSLVFSGGAGTQTLPTATLLGSALNASAGTVFDFTVDNTAGSGTCTIGASTGIVAGPAVVTGGATLTIANSTTQGIGLFRLVFSSATAAVLFRIG